MLIVLAFFVFIPPFLFDSPVTARVISIAGVSIVLWVAEVVPPFVPSLLLWVLIPVLLVSYDAKFSLNSVLSWAADPVLALFFGGFALGVGAHATGLDSRLQQIILRGSKGSLRRLLLLLMLTTAFLSMWLSNIAAAALVFACIVPLLNEYDADSVARRAMLLAVALGADLGGMATPVGTGPNAIAIAALAPTQQISFLNWMVFAVPLTLGMLGLSYLFIWWRLRSEDDGFIHMGGGPETGDTSVNNSSGRIFLIILSVTAILWLTEPLHKIPAAVIALAAAASLFITRILKKKHLSEIDWSTLLLIAGGITIGRLLEQSGVITGLANSFAFEMVSPTIALFLLCFLTAALSAVMSNTATVVLMLPIAVALIPGPSTAILVAISASFGIPLLISTPPNAMAFGQGGLRFGDLFWPGIVVMVVGCALVSLTGKQVLNLAGIP